MNNLFDKTLYGDDMSYVGSYVFKYALMISKISCLESLSCGPVNAMFIDQRDILSHIKTLFHDNKGFFFDDEDYAMQI